MIIRPSLIYIYIYIAIIQRHGNTTVKVIGGALDKIKKMTANEHINQIPNILSLYKI